MTVFVSGHDLWGEVNTAYAEVMGEHRPARAIVPVQSFRKPFLVEIVATAALGG
jgi:enamine deaminase RidA (YjgF/YER057c/UK114 family)